ncbi:MAG: hypothetical protein V4719_02550 [Planctomycetota bacterium]
MFWLFTEMTTLTGCIARSDWRSVPATRCILTALLAGATLVSSGCGDGRAPVYKTGRVSGAIRLDGKPLENVMVTFEDPTRGHGASTVVDSGNYRFETPLIIGDYTITIQASPPPPSAMASQPPASAIAQTIPTKYQKVAGSGLKAKVTEGTNKFDFELKH